jgi:hypothetical protein
VIPGKLSALFAVLLFVTGVQALAAQSGTDGRPLYKWTDEKGITHYGDSIPPQYAKQERHLLNRQAVEVGRLEGEKSDAQRAEAAAQERALQRAMLTDDRLRRSYVSVEQIEEIRDQRLDLIAVQVKVTAQYLETLESRLKTLQTQAHFFRPYSSSGSADAMPDHLAEDLVRTVREIRLQEGNLAGKRAEEQKLRTDFQAEIDRYRELKGIVAN